MAFSTIPEPEGQTGQTTTEAPRPGGCTIRERFNNLPEQAKSLILHNHRHWNVEHIDWWDSVYDMFKEDMDKIGIEVDRMYFSGFWSQGDGACFEGRVGEWGEFMRSLGYDDPALIKHAAEAFTFAVQHRGHYYHENCTSFEADLALPDSDADQWFLEHFSPYQDDRHGLREAVWMAVINKYDRDALEREFTEAFKNHMRDLYKRLEEEYDYLTSDDAVLEALEANDMLEDLITDTITEENEYA